MAKAKTVSLDPPWPEKGAGKIKRGADRHYTVIKKKEDILRVVLQSGVWPEWDEKEGAHCYMWVTNNYLIWGIWLMEALGFRYVTNIAWVKVKEDWPDVVDKLIDQMGGFTLNPLNWLQVLAAAVRIGIGQYFRGSHELCLFGVRGESMRPDKKDMVPTVFHAPRAKGDDGKEKHSKKPDRIYEIIESTSPGPYLELFARSGREGWDSWGNEV
jgi:N6-adenosine-specific RNA methylase IME4